MFLDLLNQRMGNVPIKRFSDTKVLIVLVDKILSWKHQVEDICLKVSKCMCFIHNTKTVLTSIPLKQLCFAII